MNFEILRIFAGWFEVAFICSKSRTEISASDAWDTDSPKFFIKILVDCLQNKVCNRYVVFDEEPGTYIIIIDKNEECFLKIYYSKFDSDVLGKEMNLYGELTFEEIQEKIEIDEELLNAKIDLKSFARYVYRSFEEYSTGERLEEYIVYEEE